MNRDVTDAVRRAYDRYGRRAGEWMDRYARQGGRVYCASGCVACCNMPIRVSLAEALVTDHPDRIRPAVKAVRQRINEGYRPRSLAATMVDAVRNPEKYDVRSAVTNTVPTKARAKAQPEPQPVLLPLNREELLGMVRSILRVKLGRVPRDEVVVKLAALNADQVDRLVAAARGQEDLVKAVEELVGEPV